MAKKQKDPLDGIEAKQAGTKSAGKTRGSSDSNAKADKAAAKSPKKNGKSSKSLAKSRSANTDKESASTSSKGVEGADIYYVGIGASAGGLEAYVHLWPVCPNLPT